MIVDSHVNLHAEQFAEDQADVIARARAAGVGAMLTICDRLENFPAVTAVAAAHADIWASVGVHPHHAKDEAGLASEKLVALAADPKVVGIGECGLDFHYEYSPRNVQARVFRAHIAAARETGLPLIIHTREADDEMRKILIEEQERGRFTPLLHCYTGGPALAEAALAMGGYISFSGILTFKNAEDIRDIARAAPVDRILVETDCPYLAPAPFRGRRCEPAHVVHVVDKLAEIRGVSSEEAARATTENFFRLFARAAREAA